MNLHAVRILASFRNNFRLFLTFKDKGKIHKLYGDLFSMQKNPLFCKKDWILNFYVRIRDKEVKIENITTKLWSCEEQISRLGLISVIQFQAIHRAITAIQRQKT